MTAIELNEEQDRTVLEEWKKEAEDGVKSVDAFINKLETEYAHDYGTIIHAMFAAMKATMTRLNNVTEKETVWGTSLEC